MAVFLSFSLTKLVGYLANINFDNFFDTHARESNDLSDCYV